MHHKERYVRRWVLAVLLAWAGTGWGAAPAAYDSLKGAPFDQLRHPPEGGTQPDGAGQDAVVPAQHAAMERPGSGAGSRSLHLGLRARGQGEPEPAARRQAHRGAVGGGGALGKLVPIPFQIDERDVDGWIHAAGISGKVRGSEGVFDGDDELVFMYRDTGSERLDPAAHRLSDGRIVQELTFTYDGKTRHAYVAEGSSLRDPSDYVQYDQKKWTLDATYFNFRNNPKNILMFEDFRANAGPTPDHRVLDTLILEIATGVVTPWPRVRSTSTICRPNWPA